MLLRFLRSLSIVLLLLSNLTGFVAVTASGQTNAGATNSQQQAQKSASTNENVTTFPKNSKPLSVDEDPAMIGKRKINSGLISKLSMSVEKEVALGRQLAAEVDRQAKFVDDPLITEYVNR